MRTKAGFTLVELLVVMAIIAILASIAIPNIVNYINQGQATRAIADIGGIETALTEVLADAGRSKLEQLFDGGCYGADCPTGVDPHGVANYMVNARGITNWPPRTSDGFAQAAELYTRTLYAILRSGRNVLNSTDPKLTDLQYGNVLQADVVRKLGTTYIDIANDPWGNLYNIYPGPWTARYATNDNTIPPTLQGQRMPTPFRIFTKTDSEKQLPGATSLQTDTLVTTFTDVDNNDSFEAGFPAPTNQIAFIWSNGANLLSSQVVYQIPYNTATLYDGNQGPDFIGGGDDINNWDAGSSWGRFY